MAGIYFVIIPRRSRFFYPTSHYFQDIQFKYMTETTTKEKVKRLPKTVTANDHLKGVGDF